MRAQVFPSNEEVNRILREGRTEELLQLKQQILDEQAKCDSSSVEHHVWNFMLLQTYTRLQDLDGLMLVVKDLYMYISSGLSIICCSSISTNKSLYAQLYTGSGNHV